MRGERGFTLIELAIVLVIAGLMAAIALPLIGSRVQGATLDSAVGELRATLREARATAIAQDRSVAFRGDPAGGYWLDGEHRVVPKGLRIATAAPIAFFAAGWSSGGRVIVQSGDGQRRVLSVDAVTGRASLVR